jgi:hypothetical protein
MIHTCPSAAAWPGEEVALKGNPRGKTWGGEGLRYQYRVPGITFPPVPFERDKGSASAQRQDAEIGGCPGFLKDGWLESSNRVALR